MNEEHIEQIEEKIEQVTQSTHVISQWSTQFLKNIGFADKWIDYINLIFLLLLLAVAVFILQYLTRFILRRVLSRIGKLPRMSFFKRLRERRFAHYFAMIVPFMLVKGFIPIIFEPFPKAEIFANKLADIYLIFYVIWVCISVINAFSDTLRAKEGMEDKPIDSYMQVVKIFLYFIGIIIIISILTGKDPKIFITGLGAASAVLMLIFKDTILGFVASIQVSANDMLRIGDWITMPKYGADGDVIQITLSTVKVQNFDNTITTIPPYSLVSDSFQNWRGMREAGARRLKRSVFIKQSSVRFIRDDELEQFQKNELIADYILERSEVIKEYNEAAKADKSLLINGRNFTNMGLFRKYIHFYLQQHPKINKEMTLMVRQQQPSSKGLPLELYCFADTTVWTEYEEIVSDVFDHVTAAAKYFEIELFEDISNPIQTTKDSQK